jgi:CRP-like cAMP-binding protein
MTAMAATQDMPSAAATRLATLAALTSEDLARVAGAESHRSTVPPHRDLLGRGTADGAQLVLHGWGYQQQLLPDGRRQIARFVLPGDVIGPRARTGVMTPATTTTLTEMATCAAPDPGHPESGLAQAYAVSAALDEAYLRAQITRLGRMSAYERMADWLLETRDRLMLAGLASDDGFTMPLTQELLADTLGLTSVHVNRTVRDLRQDQLVTINAKRVTFHGLDRMKVLVGYQSARPVS